MRRVAALRRSRRCDARVRRRRRLSARLARVERARAARRRSGRRPAAAITATETLDWSALDARDVVWFVYPRTAVDGGMLRRYLEAGGRARARRRLRRLRRGAGGARDSAAARRVARRRPLRRQQRAANRAPDACRPSCRSASSTLVANHPAFFSAATPATYSFSPGAALVVEGRLGKGYFVAIADPSVLINNMLDIDENLAFARALVKRTCKPGDRIHLVTQSFVARGEPPGELTPASRRRHLVRALQSHARGDRRRHPRRRRRAHARRRWRRCVATVALMLFARSWPARGVIDGHWTRAAAPDSGWRTWSYETTATQLRDEVALRLSEASAPRLSTGRRPSSSAASRARIGTRTALKAAQLWTQLRRPPVWHRARSGCARLHDAATSLFDFSPSGGKVRGSWRRRPRTMERSTLTEVAQLAADVRDEVQKAFYGGPEPIELILTTLLARGHVLLEGVPGVAKTTLVKAFAAALGCSFRRIQFTPDLLPSDITGTYVLARATARSRCARGRSSRTSCSPTRSTARRPRRSRRCSRRCRSGRSRSRGRRARSAARSSCSRRRTRSSTRARIRCPRRRSIASW